MTFAKKYAKIGKKDEREGIGTMSEHDGHRTRIIRKLDSGILLDHEVLEILLFNAIPRRNTNDLAHKLLARFKTIQGVFAASVSELQEVDGIGSSVAAYLRCIGVFYEKYYSVRLEEFPFEYQPEGFIGYVKQKYRGVNREVLDLYFLTENGEMFGVERFSEDSLFSVEVSGEKLASELAAKKPSGVILVHNHPLGNATPSKEDDAMTTKVQLLCSMHNVLFCEHLIVGVDGVYSYAASGCLQRISREYSLKNILETKEE